MEITHEMKKRKKTRNVNVLKVNLNAGIFFSAIRPSLILEIPCEQNTTENTV